MAISRLKAKEKEVVTGKSHGKGKRQNTNITDSETEWHGVGFVYKKELEKVPILGKAIKVAKNVLVDRSNRKSQLLTLKSGMKWLDVSIDLFVMIIVIIIELKCRDFIYIFIFMHIFLTTCAHHYSITQRTELIYAHSQRVHGHDRDV